MTFGHLACSRWWSFPVFKCAFGYCISDSTQWNPLKVHPEIRTPVNQDIWSSLTSNTETSCLSSKYFDLITEKFHCKCSYLPSPLPSGVLMRYFTSRSRIQVTTMTCMEVRSLPLWVNWWATTWKTQATWGRKVGGSLSSRTLSTVRRWLQKGECGIYCTSWVHDKGIWICHDTW